MGPYPTYLHSLREWTMNHLQIHMESALWRYTTDNTQTLASTLFFSPLISCLVSRTNWGIGVPLADGNQGLWPHLLSFPFRLLAFGLWLTATMHQVSVVFTTYTSYPIQSYKIADKWNINFLSVKPMEYSMSLNSTICSIAIDLARSSTYYPW